MIDATSFPDVEASLVAAIRAGVADVFADNTTPAPTIPARTVTVGYAGGGSREWGEAAVNAGINVYGATEKECREFVLDVQNVLAVLSNDLIAHVSVPAGGGTTVPRQTPPFQRYFVVTAHLRGQAIIEDPDLS